MMNYLQQNIGKLQAGGMPQTGIDPQMLAQMMSAQGAGQGVDYNGEPTPNVSGEPSFADMAQEIQGRYDKLIIPLQNKLEKLKEKLKENPTDQTIKNEIQRLEQRIDQLEQQEDLELQQLEAEVEKSGEMIDQQKQMEGYGDMQNEIPDEEMMSQQSPEMTEQLQGEMPMMQKGGRFSPYNPDLKRIYQNRLHKEFLKYQKQLSREGYYPRLDDTDVINPQNPVYLDPITVTPNGNREMNGAEIYKALNEGDFKYKNLSASGKKKYKDYIRELSSDELSDKVNRFKSAVASREDYKKLGYFLSALSFIPAFGALPYLGEGVASGLRFMGTPVRAIADILTKAFPSIGASAISTPAAASIISAADAAINTGAGVKGAYDFVTDKNVKNDFKKASFGDFAKEHWDEALWTTLGLTAGSGLIGGLRNVSKAKKALPKDLPDINIITDNKEAAKLLKQTKLEPWKNFGSGFLEGAQVPYKTAANLASSTIGNIGNFFVNNLYRFRRTPSLFPSYRLTFGRTVDGVRKPFTTWPGVKTVRESVLPQNTPKMFLNMLGNTAYSAAKIGGGYELWNLFNNHRNSVKNAVDEEQLKQIYENKSEYFDSYQDGGEVNTDNDEIKQQKIEQWYDDLLNQIGEQHPSGIEGYFKNTPLTQHIAMGNVVGNLLNDSGRHNIEAQHQFNYNYNPYTSVYDRANRQYYDALSNVNKRYDIDATTLNRAKQMPQYGSLQQNFNSRLAQQIVNNTNRLQNESNRISSIGNVQSSFGKEASSAYTNMLEQNFKNMVINENERKSYLSALDKYRKEKMSQHDSLINMLALAGNEQARNDLFYNEYLRNYLTGKKLGVEDNILQAILGVTNNNTKKKQTTNG